MIKYYSFMLHICNWMPGSTYNMSPCLFKCTAAKNNAMNTHVHLNPTSFSKNSLLDRNPPQLDTIHRIVLTSAILADSHIEDKNAVYSNTVIVKLLFRQEVHTVYFNSVHQRQYL